jgi:hypothetical protein
LATGVYRFTFSAAAIPEIAISYSTDGINFTRYDGRSNKLQLRTNDTLQIDLAGPAGWSLEGPLSIIVSRANGAPSRQNYSPFTGGEVRQRFSESEGSILPNSVWRSPNFQGSVEPNNGNNKYEVTIAFGATIPNVNGTVLLADHPEMSIRS